VAWLSELVSRAIFVAAAAIVAVICVLVAVGFLFAAVYLELHRAGLSSAAAAAAVGGVALLAAAIAALVARVRSSRSVRTAPSNGGAGDLAFKLGSTAAQSAADAMHARPYCGIAIGLLAGLAFGASPAMRQFFLDLLRHR
jgi:hypothetical protein